MDSVVVTHPALTARVLWLVQHWAEIHGWRGAPITAATRLERDLRLTSDDIFALCEFVCDETHMEFRPDFKFAQQFAQDSSSLIDLAINTLGLIIPLRGMKPFTVETIASNLQPLGSGRATA